MPIYHNCIPYSDEYDRLKLGMPTSSHFAKLITPVGGKASGQWKDYAFHLIAERLLQRKTNSYTSPAMERGLIVEAEAADWYEFSQDQTTEKIGFVTDDAGTVGCTPDRLVGDKGLLEIKCPLPKGQVEYLIEGRPQRKHRPQLQGQLLVCKDREWVDIVCWHEELPRLVLHVERDEKFQKELAQILADFNGYIDGVMAKIGEVSAAPKAELRDMLRDALEAGK